MKARQKRTEELAGEPISGSSLPGASHEDSDDDDHTKGEKHGHYRASVYGAAATTIQETSQAIACVNNWCRNFNPGHRSRPACEACRIREQVPTFAPPIASHKRKRKLTESLPTREPLNPAFAGGPLESGWFVPTGLPSLPQSTIHVPIVSRIFCFAEARIDFLSRSHSRSVYHASSTLGRSRVHCRIACDYSSVLMRITSTLYQSYSISVGSSLSSRKRKMAMRQDV